MIKMIKLTKKILALSLLLGPMMSWGQLSTPIKWSKVTLTGKGCPSGTQSTLISTDGSALSIIFQGLSISFPFVGDPHTQGDIRDIRGQVPGDVLALSVFKSCNVSLEFQVPAGKYVESAVVTVDWRGAAIIDPGINARLKTLVTYPAYRNGRLSRERTILIDKLWTESDEEFTLTNKQKVISALGCNSGNTQTIEFKHILLLNPTHRGIDVQANAVLSTDTADASLPSMDVDLVLKPCK
jgi:hypothetical protein